MAHAQKPDFVIPRKGRVHLNRWGRQFSRLLAVEECGSVVVMVVILDRPRSEVMWNCTDYPLHSPVSASLPLPCVTVCHQVPNELYNCSHSRTHTHTHTHTLGRTPPDERSAQRRNLYVHDNTQYSQETDIHTPVRFETTILGTEEPRSLRHRSRGLRDRNVIIRDVEILYPSKRFYICANIVQSFLYKYH